MPLGARILLPSAIADSGRSATESAHKALVAQSIEKQALHPLIGVVIELLYDQNLEVPCDP